MSPPQRYPDGTGGHVTGETILAADDTIIVLGPAAVAEHFTDIA